MKRLILILTALIATSLQAQVVHVLNERSAMYYLNQGSHPSKLSVRVKNWNDQRGTKTVSIGYAKIRNGAFTLESFQTKSEAIEALQAQIAQAKQGIFNGPLKRAVKSACTGSFASRETFGKNSHIITELIQRGFMGAGNFQISSSLNQDFEEVFTPSFSLYIPCRY